MEPRKASPWPIIIGIIVVLAIIGGVWASLQHSGKLTSSTSNSLSPTTASETDTSTATDTAPAAVTSSSPNSTSGCPTPAANTVSFCNGAFNTITVASGTTVTFRNDSNEAIQVDSNPHPIHTDNTQLNIGAIAPGQSKTATLTNKGTWGFHNHLNPNETGTITVK